MNDNSIGIYFECGDGPYGPDYYSGCVQETNRENSHLCDRHYDGDQDLETIREGGYRCELIGGSWECNPRP